MEKKERKLSPWFGAKDRVRFFYALDIDKMEEGLRRIKKYLENKGYFHK